MIERLIKNPDVQEVIKASSLPWVRRPVYMITSLMVARGLKVCRESRYKRKLRTTYTIEPDQAVVFAYQLLKIRTKGFKTEKVEYERFTHPEAFLSPEDDVKTIK